MLADVVQRADVGVIQGRDGLGLTLEALGERTFDRLDGDVPLQADVAGTKDVAHATSARGFEDFVRTNTNAGSEGHVEWIIGRTAELR